MNANENTLVRGDPCPTCGAVMLWTQSVWTDAGAGALAARAAYRCVNGHLIDPSETPQCPACGIPDTGRTGPGRYRCRRCDFTFQSRRNREP